MGASITTSIRMPASLKKELDWLANQEHKKKNQIILSALREYVKNHPSKDLKDEVINQCTRANEQDSIDSDWDELADDSWS
ncbi:MAG TPA: CopG family transcriptional regulator [Gammaproteobacteria bacterium]|nr:CopG family transcriptional regulator [Gammaproteobacteria bacterium]